MNTGTSGGIVHAIDTAIEAAILAPSVHNSRPWTFGVSGEEISLRADPDRKLRVADPDERQMLISCGAALFNVRTVLRGHGYEPEARVLPDPDRPLLLATVRPRSGPPAGEHTRALCREIERRHTHRAGFTGAPVPGDLVETLIAEAADEGAHLTPIRTESGVRVLAALTGAAQDVQAEDRLFSLEVIRWARPPGSTRRDGVPASGYPAEPTSTRPHHFAQRDYAWGHQWGSAAPSARHTGLVAVLTTAADTPGDWLTAGQALQRVLLRASAEGVSAAFHTQALEMPELRAFIGRHLCAGRHPQMIMRLGFTLEQTGGAEDEEPGWTSAASPRAM